MSQKEYIPRFNHARPHQGIEQRILCEPKQLETPPASGKVMSQPVLRGLCRAYFWDDIGTYEGALVALPPAIEVDTNTVETTNNR